VSIADLAIQDCTVGISSMENGIVVARNIDFENNQVDVSIDSMRADTYSVTACTFTYSNKAFSISKIDNLSVRENEFYHMKSEININNVKNLAFERNKFFNTSEVTLYNVKNAQTKSNKFIASKGLVVLSSSIVLDGNEFMQNKRLNGSGLYIENSQASINNCTFDGNTAGSHGGGIFCLGSSGSVFTSRFTKNVAVKTGGAFYCERCKLLFQGNYFQDNYPEWSSSECRAKIE